MEELDLFGNKIQKLSMIDRIGFVPLSIWEPDWVKTKKYKEIIGDTSQSREESGDYGFMKGASIFNPDLAIKILSAYCPDKARIIDPFAGGGTRGFIATKMGHKYKGIEIRKEEVDRIRAQQEVLECYFAIDCGDSCTYDMGDSQYDFCITCPPYYDLEVYSDMDNDMSNLPTYLQFKIGIKQVMRSMARSLKSGSFACWVVGNFRDKKGELIHFNGDVAKAGTDAGLILHDEIIWWGASKCAAQRAGQFAANKKSVRVHESVIIFKKP